MGIRFSVNIDRQRWLRGNNQNKLRVKRMRKASALAMATSIAETAKLLAPKDTYELENSIFVLPTRDGARVVVASEHAWFVEYGTGIYNVTGNGRKTPWVYKHREWGVVVTRGQRPQPYFQPAIDQTRLNSSRILRGVLRRTFRGRG